MLLCFLLAVSVMAVQGMWGSNQQAGMLVGLLTLDQSLGSIFTYLAAVIYVMRIHA